MHIILLIILGALWGGSFLFLRISSPELGPFVVTATRVYLAIICLLLYGKFVKHMSFKNLPWGKLFKLGLFSTAIPFTLISYGEMHITASLGAILNATTPIFTALLITLYFHERHGTATLIGLVLGFFGVIVIVGLHPMSITWETGTAIVACLAGSLFYGIGGLYAAHAIKDVPPITMATCQLIGAGIVLTPFAIYALPHTSMPEMKVIGSLLALGILCTGAAFLCYFNLIKMVGASKTLTVTFLIPVFGIIWGVIFLHEEIHATSLMGLALILSGVFLLNRPGKQL